MNVAVTGLLAVLLIVGTINFNLPVPLHAPFRKLDRMGINQILSRQFLTG